ncbi:hypothetical protein BH09ACT8_BH09ACT8_49710 [soil metagenome]
MATRPYLSTAAAVVGAAAIVAGTPALLPHGTATVTASAPAQLSNAKYQLTALTDITPESISNAYWWGWGGSIGCGDLNAGGECTYAPEDPYFPGLAEAYATGVGGVLYYVIDEALYDVLPGFEVNGQTQHLYDYYFQVGAAYTENPDSTGGYSGLAAAIYVGASQYLGPEAGALVATLQNLPAVLGQAVVTAASALPTVQIGSVTVGGGILADAYFNGYGGYDPGLSSVFAYIQDSIVNPVVPEQANATVLAKAAPTGDASAPSIDAAITEVVSSDTGATADAPADVTPSKFGIKHLADSVKPTLKPGKPSGLLKDIASALSGEASTKSAATPDSDSTAATSDKADAPKSAPHKSANKAKASKAESSE